MFKNERKKIKIESRIKTESVMKTKKCVYIFKSEGKVVSIYSRKKEKSTPCFND